MNRKIWLLSVCAIIGCDEMDPTQDEINMAKILIWRAFQEK